MYLIDFGMSQGEKIDTLNSHKGVAVSVTMTAPKLAFSTRWRFFPGRIGLSPQNVHLWLNALCQGLLSDNDWTQICQTRASRLGDRRSLVPGRVKPMIYQIDTCRFLAWCPALLWWGKYWLDQRQDNVIEWATIWYNMRIITQLLQHDSHEVVRWWGGEVVRWWGGEVLLAQWPLCGFVDFVDSTF